MEALHAADIDANGARRKVLRALGEPEDLPPIPLPAPAAAGTNDRPAVPIPELPSDVWGQLRWRQEHLPVQRLHRRSDWHGLYHLERRAAWRLASRADIDDDARYSLLHHHNEEVQRRAAAAAPNVVPAPVERNNSAPFGVMLQRKKVRHWKRKWLRLPNVFVGWGTWFRNRAVNLNAAWFKFTTRHHYRRQPRIRRPRRSPAG